MAEDVYELTKDEALELEVVHLRKGDVFRQSVEVKQAMQRVLVREADLKKRIADRLGVDASGATVNFETRTLTLAPAKEEAKEG